MTVAIIAEYNPLHNGHLYHIQKTRENFPTSRIVVIMSGDFVMRGSPSILSKHNRATHAILAGADAVIELPSFTSFLSGEGFAKSGVNVAKLIGAQVLSFGSECGDIDKLINLQNLLNNTDDTFKATFDKKMKEGKSYPRAISETLKEVHPQSDWALLDSPNNNLALMYIKALSGTGIKPFTIKRNDNGYDSHLPQGSLMSATGIRELLRNSNFDGAEQYLPRYVFESLKKNYVDTTDRFSSLVLYKIMSMSKDQLKELYDVGEGLENRLKKYAPVSHDLDEFLDKVKCKRYTLSRLRRICAYALFDVTKDKVERLNTPYARLLCCKRDCKDLLSKLKSRGVVTCYTDLNSDQIPLWELENVISDTADLLRGNTDKIRNTIFI